MMIGMGRLGQTCNNGGYWNPSLAVCCAPTGTPPEADPCSILNSPGFLAAQAADVGPLGPDGVPLSSPQFGSGSPTNLADIVGYPNNVQQDVITCSMSPGVTFVDSTGISVTCPAETSNENGILVSAYTYGQLAQMLAPGITAATPTDLLGNQPFALPPAAPVTAKAPAPSSPAQVTVPAAQIQAASNAPASAPASNGGGSTAAAAGSSSSSTSSTSGIDLSFLTNDSLISGVPNWGVAFAAVAALMILPSLIGGRR
jgi:hypothetical protein